VEPTIIFEPSEAQLEPEMTGVAERAAATRCDVVIFQKIKGVSVLSCVARLRELGIATIYVVCDLVDNARAAAVDRTAAVTEYLRSQYAPELHPTIDVVHDGIERPELDKHSAMRLASKAPQATLVTSHEVYALPVMGIPPAPWHVDVVGRYPHGVAQKGRSFRWSLMQAQVASAQLAMLRAVLHRRITHTPWSGDGVYERLLRADIGIIPIDTTDAHIVPDALVPTWQVKSGPSERASLGTTAPMDTRIAPLASRVA